MMRRSYTISQIINAHVSSEHHHERFDAAKMDRIDALVPGRRTSAVPECCQVLSALGLVQLAIQPRRLKHQSPPSGASAKPE